MTEPVMQQIIRGLVCKPASLQKDVNEIFRWYFCKLCAIALFDKIICFHFFFIIFYVQQIYEKNKLCKNIIKIFFALETKWL